MPTSTWLGGAVGVPRPERMKPRTMRMRVKPVTVNSSAGTSEMPADQQQQLDRVRAVGLHSDHRPAAQVRRGSCRGRRAGLASSDRLGGLVLDQAQRTRLGLAVGADRRDAVLAGAHEDDLLAGPDEVHAAVGAERKRGERLQAVAGRGLLTRRLDLLEDPVEPVDDADHDRQADDRAHQPAAGRAGSLSGRGIRVAELERRALAVRRESGGREQEKAEHGRSRRLEGRGNLITEGASLDRTRHLHRPPQRVFSPAASRRRGGCSNAQAGGDEKRAQRPRTSRAAAPARPRRAAGAAERGGGAEDRHVRPASRRSAASAARG